MMQAQIQQILGKSVHCSEEDGRRIPFFTVRTISSQGKQLLAGMLHPVPKPWKWH